ncbi:hypothetical protein HMPREF9389_2298 [Streptococcus sanguinis SK355]|uniref:Uncharacterized protein n=1 Tax=Streptococcus sanguinis SK355 TaxID=888816 RepID=F3UTZ0_STRSA|nr:hypothetical protein HMPREF9389_2298 [Streptococcus sanguinis SK355]
MKGGMDRKTKYRLTELGCGGGYSKIETFIIIYNLQIPNWNILWLNSVNVTTIKIDIGMI